ncbi:MAG: threonine/serine exporter family protein [Lachnospiraceae bacterium]|nr:threonine/serine exporter family protein [Lachnospiraceae bacterium]MDD3616424.1 threonine/serine exporter family protein [Lachnospiraceae bacterium]
MVVQVICAFLAIFSFSILIEVPKKYLLYTGGIGALGWLVYLLVNSRSHHVTMGTFVAAVFIAIASHVCARWLKSPVIVFFIPGILTLVPGAGMYHIVYYMIMDQQNVSMNYFVETLQLAGVIALAIFLVDSVVYQIFRRK